MDRRSDLAAAARLCALTVAWNVVVGGTAIATAIATESSALVAFGLATEVDATASAVLVWRFRAEGRSADRAERAEDVALRVVSVALAAVAAFVAVRAARTLAGGTPPEASWFGLGLASASLLVLPPLAVGKLRLSRRLDSPALRLDGLLSAAGAGLGGLALSGLALNRFAGWWWADPVAALIIAGLLIAESIHSLGSMRKARPNRST